MSGADPSMVDSQGLNALDIAVSEGHDDIIDLIQAIDLSQSSTTSPVLTATEIATTYAIRHLDGMPVKHKKTRSRI